MSKLDLTMARADKMDEFYTSYEDVQKCIGAFIRYDKDVFKGKVILCPCDDPDRSQFVRYFMENFDVLGLNGLISVSYNGLGSQSSLDSEFERGRFMRMYRENDTVMTEKGELKGSGDFRSSEVCALRDRADIIITNPPFSLFREFIKWCSGKSIIILGNLNAVAYKEVFPLIKSGSVHLGPTVKDGVMWFSVPDGYPFRSSGYREEGGKRIIRVKGVRWYTNLPFDDDRKPLELNTMAYNLEHNNRLKKKLMDDFGMTEYPHYDNFDAIEVPFSNAIPSDYDGVMGVPISFLDRMDDRFEIVDMSTRGPGDPKNRTKMYSKEDTEEYGNLNVSSVVRTENGLVLTYTRVLIRFRKGGLYDYNLEDARRQGLCDVRKV